MRRAIPLVCSLLVAGLAVAADGDRPSSNDVDDRNAAVLKPAPEAVRKTVEREANGRVVSSLRSHEEYGHTVYTALITRPDSQRPLRLKVAEDGAVVWRNDLTDRAKEDAAARREGDHSVAPAGQAGGSNAGTVPADAEKKPERGDDGQKKDIQSAKSDAKSARREGRLAIEELPDAAKKSLLREADGGAISDIALKRERDRDVYRARFRDPQGKTHRIRIGADGEVLSKK